MDRTPLPYLHILCLGLVFFFLAASPGHAQARPAIEIADLQETWLREEVEYLRADRHMSRHDVEKLPFAPLTDADLNRGIGGETYWLRFRLYNNSDQPKSWVLHNETSYLDNLIVHYRDQGESTFTTSHLSDRTPFHQRPLDYRKLAFQHQTPPHTYTDIYLKTYFDKPDAISLNFRLAEEGFFWRSVRNENFLFGLYYGVLFILILIAAVFGVLLRQKNAFFYAAFLTSTALMWLLFNGYAFQYLWPDSVFWHNEGFHIVFLSFAFFALQFSKAFLRTKMLQPRLHRFLNCLQALAVVALILRLAGVYRPVLDIAFGLLMVLAFVVPAASWRAYRKGLHYARWYTVAWLVYSVCLLLALTSAYSDWLPLGMQALAYMQIGSIFEAVLLLIAMAEWLLRLDSDRRRAIALANEDPLTALGNRRLLQLQYEVFRQKFYKDRQPVFLIMLDLDYFKVINDTYGHEAGDYVLREMAALLKKQSRDGDVCIRYGGEEFAVLLRAEDLEAVWQVAERIRIEFAERPTLYNGQRIEHTLSSGITRVLSDDEVLSVQEMMSRADAALYQGKDAGRNCTTIYTDENRSAVPNPTPVPA